MRPAGAHAQTADSAVIESITKLNKKALEQYDNLNFDEAQETLNKALTLCTKNGLDKHPIKARTLIHMGVVVLAEGASHHDEAVKQFQAAIGIQPDIKLTERVANPEVQQVFDEAKAGVGKTGTAPGDAGDVEKSPGTAGLAHDPIASGAKGSAIPISVTTDASLGAKRVVLSYRPEGASDFVSRDLKEFTPGNWSTVIPNDATGGAEVAYTLTVENEAKEPVAARGSASDPIVIKLNDARAAQPKKRRAPGTSGESPGEEPGDDEPVHAAHVVPPDWFLGLGAGTGYGWASGYADVNSDAQVVPQFGASRLGHVLPEVGYFVSPDLMLSLQLRWQAVSGATPVTDPGMTMCGASHVCDPATGAVAVFGRLTWLFGAGSFHPYLAGSLGAGNIRHLATFSNGANYCGSNHSMKCVDTVAAGPILLGPGAGFFINVTPNFAFTLGVNTLVGFTVFTFHVDVNAGVALEL